MVYQIGASTTAVTQKKGSAVQWTATSDECPPPTEVLKDMSRNASDFKDTLAVSGVYKTERTGINTKMTGRVQAGSSNSILESM